MARPSRASAPSTRIIGFRLTEDEERRLDELVVEQGHKDRSVLLRSWLAQKPEPQAIRFTADEERRLDELVAEHRYENRAGLFRAWLDEKKPNPEAILARCTPTAKTLFSFVVDEAKRHKLEVTWKSNGCRVRAQNWRWSMRCNEPNLIDVDFIDAQSIRDDELATGLWNWHGTEGLQLSVNESNAERVRERIVRIFDTRTASKNTSKDMRRLTEELDMRHVYDALRQHQDERVGLIYVPDVVRAVVTLVPVERVHAILRMLVKRGVLELRPDAGGEFLRAEDAVLCPPGPRETVFAYARWKSKESC